MQMIALIAGLAWDPEIRGFLAVLTGIVVLMGSVWLILSTNSGTRLGTLLASGALLMVFCELVSGNEGSAVAWLAAVLLPSRAWTSRKEPSPPSPWKASPPTT